MGQKLILSDTFLKNPLLPCYVAANILLLLSLSNYLFLPLVFKVSLKSVVEFSPLPALILEWSLTSVYCNFCPSRSEFVYIFRYFPFLSKRDFVIYNVFSDYSIKFLVLVGRSSIIVVVLVFLSIVSFFSSFSCL